jgi:cytoskeletal protein RodZ
MVLKIKGALIIFPILVLALLLFGCNEQNAQVSEPEILIEPAEEEIMLEAEVEVISRQGDKDRLPGSLKWGSIAMYKANEDFLADHPEGLKAVSSYDVQSTFTETSSGSTTTTSVSSETSTSQGTTAAGGNSSTTSVTTSGGGISTSVTVDGSLTMTETTTYDSGDDGWFNID